MGATVWLSILCTVISLICCGVTCAAWRSVRAFGASRPLKRLQDLEVSAADQASTLESLTKSLRRVSSKVSMREHRAAEAAEEPPRTKEEAKRRYLHGKTHAQVALMALNGVPKETE